MYFKDLVAESGFDEKGRDQSSRTMGNQWLNTYIRAWRRVFHFNMDARLLMSGDGAQSAMYATKYATKSQTTFDNINVIEIALNKRVQRELMSEDTLSDHRKGQGRLMAMARESTNVMEIGGPLACLYLLRNGAGYFSHDFQPLLLVQALNLIDQTQVTGVLINGRNNTLKVRTAINDYIHRPEELESMCLYDFVKWYKRVPVPKDEQFSLLVNNDETGPSSSDSNADDDGDDAQNARRRRMPVLKFQQSHPESVFFGLRRLEWPKIPQIIGPRLPDVYLIKDDEDKAELYWRVSLCLYCPFRSTAGFLDEITFSDISSLLWLQ